MVSYNTKLGLYGVYLCHNGILKQVALDDYIPCHL